MFVVSSNVSNGNSIATGSHEIDWTPVAKPMESNPSAEKAPEDIQWSPAEKLDEVLGVPPATPKPKRSAITSPESPSKKAPQSPRHKSTRQKSSKDVVKSSKVALGSVVDADPVVEMESPKQEITMSPQRITRRFKPALSDRTLIKVDVPPSPRIILDVPLSPAKKQSSPKKHPRTMSRAESMPSLPLSPTKSSHKKKEKIKKPKNKDSSHHPSSPRKSKSSKKLKAGSEETKKATSIDEQSTPTLPQAPLGESLGEKSFQKFNVSPSKGDRESVPVSPKSCMKPKLQLSLDQQAPTTAQVEFTVMRGDALHSPDSPTRKTRDRMMAMYNDKKSMDALLSPAKNTASKKSTHSVSTVKVPPCNSLENEEPVPVIEESPEQTVTNEATHTEAEKKSDSMKKSRSRRNVFRRFLSMPDLAVDQVTNATVSAEASNQASQGRVVKSKSRRFLFGGKTSDPNESLSKSKGKDDGSATETSRSPSELLELQQEKKATGGRRNFFRKSVSTLNVARWFKSSPESSRRQPYHRSRSVMNLSSSGGRRGFMYKKDKSKSTRNFRGTPAHC